VEDELGWGGAVGRDKGEKTCEENRAPLKVKALSRISRKGISPVRHEPWPLTPPTSEGLGGTGSLIKGKT